MVETLSKEDFECVVCLEIANKPHTCNKCSCLVCGGCIKKCKVCPGCRGKVNNIPFNKWA